MKVFFEVPKEISLFHRQRPRRILKCGIALEWQRLVQNSPPQQNRAHNSSFKHKNTNIVIFFFDSAFQNEFYSYPLAVRAQQRCEVSCAEKQGNPKSEKETYSCDPIRL